MFLIIVKNVVSGKPRDVKTVAAQFVIRVTGRVSLTVVKIAERKEGKNGRPGVQLSANTALAKSSTTRRGITFLNTAKIVMRLRGTFVLAVAAQSNIRFIGNIYPTTAKVVKKQELGTKPKR